MAEKAELEQESATWIAVLAAVATNTAATYRAAVRSLFIYWTPQKACGVEPVGVSSWALHTAPRPDKGGGA